MCAEEEAGFDRAAAPPTGGRTERLYVLNDGKEQKHDWRDDPTLTENTRLWLEGWDWLAAAAAGPPAGETSACEAGGGGVVGGYLIK